ncbi:MAG: lasso peptide [Fischerella sp.]|nr:lasso peptide [Fischerella sp.]
MKNPYKAPQLTFHGDVTEITQILGGESRKDFLFFSGTAISDGNDLGSRDVFCDGKGGGLGNCK